MDRAIGEFLDWLKARGDLDRTVIAFTADHGERLGERGLLGHILVMDQYLLRVPLLLRYPPLIAPSRIERRVQLDGLAGYILHLAGVAAPVAMAGNALHLQDRDIVVAQYRTPHFLLEALRLKQPDFDGHEYLGEWFFVADDRFAYVCSPTNERSDQCTLNDMANDPDWVRDARAAHPDLLAKLKAVAVRLPRYASAESSDLDPDTRDRLRSLGYVK